MGLPKLWIETLKRLDDLESRVGQIELIKDPDSETEPEPETEQKPE